MALLSEYALTPDVFDAGSYPHEEVGTARLENLKAVLLEEALLRNLRNGEWLGVFRDNGRSWHRRGLELLKKLAKQNRLRPFNAALPTPPRNDLEWCNEALASHENEPLEGVISTEPVVAQVGRHPQLGRIDRLGSFQGWTTRSTSVRLKRCDKDYQCQLNFIMSAANSIMIIDPHLDPSLARYRGVLDILLMASGRSPIPLIEIHRVVYVGSGRNREIVSSDEWESRFRCSLASELQSSGLIANIFIWDDHHDRYLITDLIGIEMANGYDTSGNPNDITTWSRISRTDRDDIQREFDPASGRHALKCQFQIP